MPTVAARTLCLPLFCATLLVAIAPRAVGQTLTWSGGGANNQIGTGANWIGGVAPTAGQSMFFGSTPAGDYTVVNNLAATSLGTLNVFRATPSSITTLQGGYTGKALRSTGGVLIVDGGTTNVTGDPFMNYSFSLGAGAGSAGVAALTVRNAATVNFTDASVGVAGATGTLTFENANTIATGSTATNVENGSLVVRDSALLQVNQFYTGSTTGSTATLTLDGANTRLLGTGDAPSFSTNGTPFATTTRLGSTTLNVTAGAKLTFDYVTFNWSNRPVGSSVASSSAIAVSGTGSAITARRSDNAGWFALSRGDRTTSTLTLSSNGLVDANLVSIGYGIASTATATLSGGGKINADVIELGGASTSGSATSTLTVNAGGLVLAKRVIASRGTSAVSTVTVDGAASRFDVVDYFQPGGGANGTLGSGRATFTVTGGAAATFGAIQTGLAPSAGALADPIGTTITVSGANSRISVGGGGSNASTSPLTPDVVLGGGRNTKQSLYVTDGGLFEIASTNTNPLLNGTLYVADATEANAIVNVDGASALLRAGVGVLVATGDAANAFTAAHGEINLRNGGRMSVGGDVLLSTYASAGTTSSLTIGGGAQPTDVDSRLIATGSVFAGGTGSSTSPTVGAPATITINNGRLESGGLLVYAGSAATINNGVVRSSVVAARGGTITLGNSGLLDGDEFSATNGGAIDLGRGAGISSFGGADVDLNEIRNLILAGRNGGAWNGANGIRSNLAASDARYGVGYADIDAVGMTSFAGVSFVASDQAIVFRATLLGDANLDATVNFADLLIVSQNYNATGRQWYTGDSTYDGVVNFDDLLALAQNYGVSSLTGGGIAADVVDFATDWALARSLVPEPSALAILCVIPRRRRVRRL